MNGTTNEKKSNRAPPLQKVHFFAYCLFSMMVTAVAVGTWASTPSKADYFVTIGVVALLFVAAYFARANGQIAQAKWIARTPFLIWIGLALGLIKI